MATTFYVNGDQVSKQSAKRYLDHAAMNQGYEPENYESAWKAVGRSEESREFINEVSGYALEIVVS